MGEFFEGSNDAISAMNRMRLSGFEIVVHAIGIFHPSFWEAWQASMS
jgi:hypothetical protein